MNKLSSTLALSFALLTIGCGSDELPEALVNIPANLQPTAGETLKIVVPARGVQIYECRVSAAGTFQWAFVAPEADLFNERGDKIGSHYVGPHWESNDGSKVLGTVKDRSDAPSGDAIPWLWLTAKSVGKEGAFSRTTSILRVRTVGGLAPATGCGEATAGVSTRIAYTADYYFYAAN